MASLTLQAIVRQYGALRVIHGVDLDIADGEFVVLVGPSGCGKSTLLRMIAGLDGHRPRGDIADRRQRASTTCRRRERGIAMVFQTYALYPHMTRAREHRLRASSCRACRRPRSTRRVARPPRMLRHRRPARPQARPALRRPAPARRHRPRHRARARASSCSTSRSPTSTPSCASQMRIEITQLHQRLGTTIDLRHPRPGRGHDHGRPHRGDERAA
jgi:lactose/L-arabinose transport system ATP-binding protein